MIAYTQYVHDGRVKRHAQALAERGDHIDVICLDNPQTGAQNGVNVIAVPMPQYRGGKSVSYLGSYLRFFAAAFAIAVKRSRQQPYDLAIVCTMPDAAVFCALPLRVFGTKILLDIHDTMPELYREKFPGRRGAIGERCLRVTERISTWCADRVLAVHEPHRRRLELAGVNPDKIFVVLNTPDQRLFGSIRNAASMHKQTDEFTIICHGTIARRLSLDVAFEALRLLKARLPQVKLLVLGAGDYLSECRALASRLNLEETVQFRPPVALEQLPEVLRQASVGLVPNRANSVTDLMLPVKLLEYAAVGLPVIAARLKTIEHYFDDSAIRFFRPGDAADLAAAIEDLYSSPERRLALARNARRVIDRLSWQTQRETYYSAIDSILGHPHGGNLDRVAM